MTGIVVVGAGQAGSTLAAELRSLGYKGKLTLIGDEPVPPYQRPPLSKGYLLGDMDLSRLFLRPQSFYGDQGIDLQLGKRVTAIDPSAKYIRVGDARVAYDQLALTIGSEPRRLPAAIGGQLSGVHTMRDLADADALAPEFVAGRRVLIIGGGFVGLEAAAVAAQRGLVVTLVEMAPRILQRVAASETADHFRVLHERNKVTIHEAVGLDHLTGAQRVNGAVLTDGQHIPVDFVIVGIGILPTNSIAACAGLATDNGIMTDAQGRTSAQDIWAAGDCTSFPWMDTRLRLESVGNAIDHAKCVAANMLGADRSYVPQPWFWSDQYDVKLQIAGLNVGYDKVITRQAGGQSVSFWYYAAERLLAVDAVNDPRAYMIGKKMIEAGFSPPVTAVQDEDADLKALIPR